MSRATSGRWQTWRCQAWRGAILALILATGCSLGCRGILGQQAIPEDPLFAKRKPVESKAVTAAPMAIAFVEPPLPLDPDSARAFARDTKDSDDNRAVAPEAGPASSHVPGILTSQPAARQADERKRRRERDQRKSRDADGPILPPTIPH